MAAPVFALWLEEPPPERDSWVERQRRLWEEALDRLEKALGRRKSKGEKDERR
jgi:hypothetical protein